jgi:hypothetical protein
MIGGFDMHLRGGSQVPENPPGPPQISPTVLAQTLQHLKNIKEICKQLIKFILY